MQGPTNPVHEQVSMEVHYGIAVSRRTSIVFPKTCSSWQTASTLVDVCGRVTAASYCSRQLPYMHMQFS